MGNSVHKYGGLSDLASRPRRSKPGEFFLGDALNMELPHLFTRPWINRDQNQVGCRFAEFRIVPISTVGVPDSHFGQAMENFARLVTLPFVAMPCASQPGGIFKKSEIVHLSLDGVLRRSFRFVRRSQNVLF
jgi:hypothetical protein